MYLLAESTVFNIQPCICIYSPLNCSDRHRNFYLSKNVPVVLRLTNVTGPASKFIYKKSTRLFTNKIQAAIANLILCFCKVNPFNACPDQDFTP